MQKSLVQHCEQYCTITSSLPRGKAGFLLSGEVLGVLRKTVHDVSIFPTSFLLNYLDEPTFIVDDLNVLLSVKMLWTVVDRRNKTIDLLRRKSTSSLDLECFLADYKDRNNNLKCGKK